MLAQTNRDEFRKSGTTGKCVEARELIIALPECFAALEPKALLQQFTNYFKSCHTRHLPSYVFRQAGHLVLGGSPPVMGTIPITGDT